MLQKGKKPKNDAERMVLNNYEAMRFIREKKDDALSPGFILDVHQIVTKGTIDDEYVGHFRTTNEIVVADSQTGLVYHTPPDFSEIEGFIEDLCAFANSDGAGSKTSTDTSSTRSLKGLFCITSSGTFTHSMMAMVVPRGASFIGTYFRGDTGSLSTCLSRGLSCD